MRTFAARFWSHVDKAGDCWPWTKSLRKSGYGQCWDGRRVRAAHRVAWELTFGPIPAGAHVCHRCDNPLCCKPAHLFLGTGADNMADMVAKGRSLRGERHPGAKLTEEDVLEIRRLYAPPRRHGIVREIARRFGVTPSAVAAIGSGRCWQHAPRGPHA